MRPIEKLSGGAVFFGLAFVLALVSQPAASRSPQGMNTPQAGADEPVPAYHAQAPQGALPTTMAPELFSDPMVQNAYTLAAKIKKTLYRSPAIVIATALRATAACSIALPANTAPNAAPACMRTSTRTNSRRRAKPPRRFGPASSRANGNLWTPPNTGSRCPQSDTKSLAVAHSKHCTEVSCHHAMQFVN